MLVSRLSRSTRCLIFAIVLVWVPLDGHIRSAEAKQIHVVSAGDTLWQISRNYGCDIEELRVENGLKTNVLDIGRALQIPSEQRGASRSKAPNISEGSAILETEVRLLSRRTMSSEQAISYKIVSGDTLGSIAHRYGSSIADLQIRNRLTGSEIFAGKRLQILPGESGVARIAPILLGQSLGLAHRGHLRHATRLKPGVGFLVRHPARSFGTKYTVDQITRAIALVRRHHPHLHRLAVGDISAERGGKISHHASHQSGRDVDLGFYFKKRPAAYPREFVDATAKNLNFDATWSLLMAFVARHGKDGGTDKIFLNYVTQRVLYRLARKRGITKAKLAKILQYPHGRKSRQAIVWHEPGHTEHMHVRFECPANDQHCD